MAEKVFLNDKLVEIGKGCIAVTDSGFLYGAGLFETMRSYNGVVFSLNDHIDRLFFSAQHLGVTHGFDKKYISEAVYKVLKANKLSDARIRLTLSSGSMSANEEKPRPTLLIAATKFQPYPAQYYKNGVLVVLCNYRQNPAEPTYGHKTTSYFSRMLALKEAHEKKAAEALWFTTNGRLAEGCISNVFLVKDSVIYTPPIVTPVLAGVSRKTVCRLAMENSIEFKDGELTIDDLLGAEEIFLTNVIMQILPVTRVEKHIVGDGRVGEMTEKLMALYDEFVKQKCRENK